MSRGGLKNVGIWPLHRGARELGPSGGIRGDRIEMSWSGTPQHERTQTRTHKQACTYTSPPGALPGHSVAVMPLNSRLHHTHSELPWTPSNHQCPPLPPRSWFKKKNLKKKIRVVISKHKNQDDNEPKRKMLIVLQKHTKKNER